MGREKKSLEARVDQMAQTLASLLEKANESESRLSRVEAEVRGDTSPNDNENNQNGHSRRNVFEENCRLKADLEHKVLAYETRLNEADIELNALKAQLTELMGVYDDLQVSHT